MFILWINAAPIGEKSKSTSKKWKFQNNKNFNFCYFGIEQAEKLLIRVRSKIRAVASPGTG